MTTKSKVQQMFDGDEVAVAFETAIHANLRLTTDPDTGEVEVEVMGFTIPSWMTNFDREMATTAFMIDGGTTLSVKNLPNEVFMALESTDSPIEWE